MDTARNIDLTVTSNTIVLHKPVAEQHVLVTNKR